MKTPPTAKVIPIHRAKAPGEPVEAFSGFEQESRIYPRSVRGWFTNWRWLMVWITQLVFYGLPWLQWNGRQAVLFDLSERRFYIFNLVLHPQDFIYLAALLIISALALFFFTALAGRLWCGYACPQTVYTEIFLWVERHTEGDRSARMRLDAAPWGAEKIARKGAKQFLWIGIALVTGFTFVGYFTPIHTLSAEALALSFSPWEWFWVLFYGFATYGNAGYMREQVCKYMCPYARFQSALMDTDSLVIAYDTARGEARGARARSASPQALGLGDCIDCTLCVQVCPTGIDIRNGLQNECIACAACIDVCDTVMDKMGYPKGLIRYSSGRGISQGLTSAQMLRRIWRPRVLIYGALLSGATAALVWSLSTRAGFAVDVMKDRATLGRVVAKGYIENVYRLQIMNGTELSQQYRIAVSGLAGLRIETDTELTVPAAGIGSIPVRLVLPPEAADLHRGITSPITFEVQELHGDPEKITREKSTFYVPR
ncbi:MAG: cytochrome c oxidase accessory protein CcoG [Burkholderiaceae bacterium]|nr:cytochrome c oxidase accessory protein CcoG [Burkholderiales bacterium]MBP8053768.1 cytochrome c oxidase accessory protein CcoG [Burkholderiaceae bacterium]